MSVAGVRASQGEGGCRAQGGGGGREVGGGKSAQGRGLPPLPLLGLGGGGH